MKATGPLQIYKAHFIFGYGGAEKQASGTGKARDVVRGEKTGDPNPVLLLGMGHACIVQAGLDGFRRGGGRIDKNDVRTRHLPDGLFQQRIMCTPQNQAIRPIVSIQERSNIVRNDTLHNGAFKPAFLSGRNQKGAGNTPDSGIGTSVEDSILIGASPDCGFRGNDSDIACGRGMAGRFRSGVDDTNDRNGGKCLAQSRQRRCCGRIARDNQKLDLAVNQFG